MSDAVPLRRPLPRVVIGERLRLEVWEHERLQEVRDTVAQSRAELAAFLGWATGPLDEAEEARFQAQAHERWRGGYMAGWAILEDGALRGMLGLHRRGGPHELEIGYWLATSATGRGVMTEAARLATDVAFDADGVELVEIVHDVANARSEGVPRRLGYRRVAAFRAPLDDGEPHGLAETGLKVRWVVSRDEWLARRARSSVLATED